MDNAINCEVDCVALVVEADQIKPLACIARLRQLALDGGRCQDGIIAPIRA
jgi:hypothetical protein